MPPRRGSRGRSEERNFGAEIGTGGRKLGERVDVLPKPSAPSREDLGDGWWRLSGPKSGSFRKAGLHTIAEASKGRPLVCAFESRVEVVRSAVGAECDGDRSFAVEASFKACVDSANARTDDDGVEVQPEHQLWLVIAGHEAEGRNASVLHVAYSH